MRNKTLQLLLLLPLLLAGGFAYGQGPLEAGPKKARVPADYKLRTLKQIGVVGSALIRGDVDRSTSAGRGEAHTFVHGNLLPSRVRVIYQGSARPLTRNRKEVIAQWAQRYAGNPDHYTVPYTSEVLFAEAGVSHWLVVETTSLPEFRKYKKGKAVDLYLIRLGAFKTRGKWRWVLLVDSFAMPKRT